MYIFQALFILHPAVSSHPSLQFLLLSERTGRAEEHQFFLLLLAVLSPSQ